MTPECLWVFIATGGWVCGGQSGTWSMAQARERMGALKMTVSEKRKRTPVALVGGGVSLVGGHNVHSVLAFSPYFSPT